MQDYRTRRAARLTLLKRQTVLKWIAGFTVTVAVAVVSAFAPAASAEARFLNVSAAGTDIAYELYLDASLEAQPDTELRIVARDQFGDRTQKLASGMSSGVFTGLRPDTEYRLLVEIDAGFGFRTLAKTTVRTDPGPGGAIVGYSVAETGGYQWETFLAFTVSLHVSDPGHAFTAVRFRYNQMRYAELCEITQQVDCEMTIEPSLSWTTVDVTSPDQTIELPPLWKDEYRLYWVLEAIDAEGTTVVLDQRTFDTAPVFFAYLNVADAGVDRLDVSAHVEANSRVEATFEVVVTCPLGETVARFPVEPMTSEDQGWPEGSASGVTRVDGLLRETEYHLELFATYQDPLTGFPITSRIGSAHGWTTPLYSGSFTWTASDVDYTFSADYRDPSGMLGPIHYYVYLWTDGSYQYQSGGEVPLIADGDRRTAAFTIPVPGEYYRIIVYLEKTPIAGVTYSGTVADIVRNPA